MSHFHLASDSHGWWQWAGAIFGTATGVVATAAETFNPQAFQAWSTALSFAVGGFLYAITSIWIIVYHSLEKAKQDEYIKWAKVRLEVERIERAERLEFERVKESERVKIQTDDDISRRISESIERTRISDGSGGNSDSNNASDRGANIPSDPVAGE